MSSSDWLISVYLRNAPIRFKWCGLLVCSALLQCLAMSCLLSVTKLPNDSQISRGIYALLTIACGCLSFAAPELAHLAGHSAENWTQQVRRLSWRSFVLSVLLTLMVTCLLGFGADYTRLTREIVLIVCTSVVLLFFWASILVCACWRSASLRAFGSFVVRGPRNRRLVVLLSFLAFWVFVFSWMSGLAALGKSSYMSTVLGDDFDLCAMEGMRQRKELTTAFTWCDWLPRRAFNFYTGSEACRGDRFSYFDKRTRNILVPASCPSGRGPRVIVEDFESSDLYRVLTLPESLKHDTVDEMMPYAKKYAQYLQTTFGGAVTDRFLVTKDDQGRIIRVELHLTTELMQTVSPSQVSRSPPLRLSSGSHTLKSFIAKYGSKLYHIPLLSEAMVVVCDDEEELHTRPIFPPEDALEPLTEPLASTASSPTNVVAIMIDAVSRQEVTRSLDKLKRWMRAKAQLLRPSHLVAESLGMTTVGHSTSGNWAPMMTGVLNMSECDRQRDGSLFKLIKEKYRENMSTSLIGGMCESIIQKFSIPRFGSGFGTAVPGYVDREYFAPLCHSSYGLSKGNFRGAYGIVKRCLGHRHVHEHMLDYLLDVLEHDMRRGVPFFHNLWLLEGHEGTHGVLKIIDEDLVEFLEILDERLNFFNSTRNSLLIYSDHGNHMGPIFTWTVEGAWERTTPMSLWILPRSAAQQIDMRRAAALGASEHHFNERMRLASTPYDMYLTMRDLFAIDSPSRLGRELENSSSLFTQRPKEQISSCSDIGGESICALSYCETSH